LQVTMCRDRGIAPGAQWLNVERVYIIQVAGGG